jgi:hypothetical protein
MYVFAHAPTVTDRALVFPGHFLDERQEPNRPQLIEEWSTDTPRSSMMSKWTPPFCKVF